MIRSGIGQVTIEVEVRTVTGSGKGTLAAIEARGATHVRANARECPQLPIAIHEKPLDGTRGEGTNRAVGQVGPGLDRVPPSVDTHQRSLGQGGYDLRRSIQADTDCCDPRRQRA